MHPYSIKSNAEKMWYIVAILSFIFYFLFSFFNAKYISHVISTEYGVVLSVSPIFIFGFFYGIFYFIIDKYGWKYKIIQMKYKIPNLNGKWTGKIISKYEEKRYGNTEVEPKEINIDLKIKQTWKKISIILIAEESESHSLTTSIIETHGTWQIYYQYLNEPKIHSSEEMNMHYGTAVLNFDETEKTLKGYYYNKERDTSGEISLKYEQI